MNHAIVTIASDVKADCRMDIKTNGVHPAIIYEAALILHEAMAKQMVKEAQSVVGDDPKAQEQYLDQMLKQQGVGKGNEGGNIKRIIKGN